MKEETKYALAYYAKLWAGRASLILMIVLMAPTLAIAATWNTLPGDKLYPVKTYLEKAALALVGDNFSAKTELRSKFVQNRFEESRVMLAESSNEGFQSFTDEVALTKTEIVEARERVGTKDEVVAQEKADKFVAQLEEYSQQLEETKTQLVAQSNQSTQPIATQPTTKPTTQTVKQIEEKVVVKDPESKQPQAEVVEKTKVVQESVQTPVVAQQDVAVETQIIELQRAQEEIKKAIEELHRPNGHDNQVGKDEKAKDNNRNNENRNDGDKKKDKDH